MNGNYSIRTAVRVALACGVAAGFAFAGSAYAAQQSQTATGTSADAAAATQQQLKAVEVTGTRIKRTSVEQAQPIQIITQAQIKASGFTTIGQVLQSMSSVGSSLNTQNNNGANSTTSSAGQTTLNLRNLGPQRTLILVNGHRWITDLDGAVDLNTIPTSIIDHVEVLQDGASAIYGSDAIAGVVNIITIKNFNGAEASAYVGIHHGDGHWDGQVRHYSATLGFGSSRGNVLLNATYEDEQGVSSANRTMAAIPIFGTANTRGSSATPQGRFEFYPPYGGSISSPDNFPAASTGLTSAQCPAVQNGTKADPDWLPFCDLTTIVGKPGTSPSDFRPFTAADNYNYAPWAYLITPDQRFSVYTAGNYDLADNLTWDIEAAFQQRNSSQQAAPNPIFISGSSATADLPPNGDFNPFNFELNTNAPTVGPNFLQSIGRRVVEGGPRINTEDENLVHVRTGLKGFFDLSGSEWDWDAGYLFSKDSEQDHLFGVFDGNRLSVQLSDPAACEAQAALGCTPINFFGGATNPITPAQLAYAQYVDSFSYNRNSHGAYGDVSNSALANLPAGPLGLAFGYQFRSDSGSYLPSAIDLQQPNPPAPTSGSIATTAAYVEIDVPLLANIPMAKLVDLDVASRRTEVQAAGESHFNTSSRAGLKWQPTDSLLLRGTWSQGFRAPDISELFAGRTSSSIQFADPCSSYPTSGVSASVQQLCAAQGVPPSYSQTYNQISSQSAGNPGLKPETSLSRTVGFVYSPDWLAGFNFNMDYYKIELENSIQPFGAQNILQGCYFQGISADCARISRQSNGSGNLRTINDSVTNIGGTLTEGYDIGATYAFPMTPIGQFSAALQATYTREFDQYFPDGAGGITTVSLAGIERGANVFPLGIPRWKALGNITWNLGNWNAAWKIQYIGPMQEACSDYLDNSEFSFANMGVCSQPDLTNNSLSRNRLAATVYHDAQVSYTMVPWNTTFTFGVNNLFNKNPPEDVLSTMNSFDTSNYPIPGRFFYASVSVKF